MGLKLVNKENVFGFTDLLSKRLESDHEKKILIIFDNLYTKVPLGDDKKTIGCKLLRYGEI